MINFEAFIQILSYLIVMLLMGGLLGFCIGWNYALNRWQKAERKNKRQEVKP